MTDTVRMIVGSRWRVILVVFLLEVAGLVAVSVSPFFPGELASTQSQYNSIKPVLNQSAISQVASIFANNFRVAMPEMIPVGGPFVLGVSMYETARIVEVTAVVNGEGIAAVLATLFLLPHTWLELPAYAIATTESGYLLYAASKRSWQRFLREVRFLIANFFIITGVLAVAAIFEVTEIQLEPLYGGTGVFLALLTWVPFALIASRVVRFWRAARRDAPALEQEDSAAGSLPDPGQPRAQEGTMEGGTGFDPGASGLWNGDGRLRPGEEAPEHDADQHDD